MAGSQEPSENWRSPTLLGLLQSHVVIWNAFVEESSRSSAGRHNTYKVGLDTYMENNGVNRAYGAVYVAMPLSG